MSDLEPTVEQLLGARDELFDLSLEDLRRRYVEQPYRQTLTFGAGQPAEQTIIGNQEHPFYGVAISNPSPKVIYVGFESGGALGSPLVCPSGSLLVWPARSPQVSLAVSPTDANGPAASIAVLRLQEPPRPAIYPLGPASASAVTTASPRSYAVTNASTTVLPANPLRRGLSIVNTGIIKVSLGLGAAAIAGDDIVLYEAGSWDGMISGLLWSGEVTVIAAEATTLAVVEV